MACFAWDLCCMLGICAACMGSVLRGLGCLGCSAALMLLACFGMLACLLGTSITISVPPFPSRPGPGFASWSPAARAATPPPCRRLERARQDPLHPTLDLDLSSLDLLDLLRPLPDPLLLRLPPSPSDRSAPSCSGRGGAAAGDSLRGRVVRRQRLPAEPPPLWGGVPEEGPPRRGLLCRRLRPQRTGLQAAAVLLRVVVVA